MFFTASGRAVPRCNRLPIERSAPPMPPPDRQPQAHLRYRDHRLRNRPDRRPLMPWYVDYLPSNAHTSVTRQGLPRLTPDPIMPRKIGKVVAIPQVGGLTSSLRTPRRLIRTRSCEYSLRSGRPGVVFMICASVGFFVLDQRPTI